MISAYVLIAVSSGSEKKVAAKLKKIKNIAIMNEIFGEWDIILKVDVDAIEELDQIVTEEMRKIQDVKLTNTLIVKA